MRRAFPSTIALFMAVVAILAMVGFAPTPQGSKVSSTVSLLAKTSQVAPPASQLTLTDNAVVSNNASVSTQPENGVRIGTGEKAFTVGVPVGNKADGQVTNNGSVVFATGGSSDDAVIATQSGAQFLKILKDSSAPDAFKYPVDLPTGGRIALSTSGPEGSASAAGAVILDSADQVIALINAPWAKDANSAPVKTYFTTDGSSITQHVDLDRKDIAFPVVADPNIHLYRTGAVITFTYDDMVAIAAGGVVAIGSMIGVTAPTIIGPIAVTSVLSPIATAASWSVATRSCAWIWYTYPWTLQMGDFGYYNC